MDILFQVLLVILLVLLNGYFVASEFALVGVRKTRIDELVKRGNPAAKLVQKALTDLDSFISATQLGITIASLALGWVGEPFLSRIIEPFFSFLPKETAGITAHGVAIAFAFALITVLHIVIGELAPKSVALQRAEKVSLVIIAPLLLFTTVFRPFIWFLNGAGGLVLKLFGFIPPSGHQLVHSEEEIKMILSQSAQSGVIARQEAEMVQKVFKLGNIPVKTIMVPRTEIIAFNVAMTLKEVVKRIEHTLHSRFPVYEHSIDSIIGFIHVKDVYKEVYRNKDNRSLVEMNIIREVISVPEAKTADEVLLDMQRKRIHIAVVSDGFGGTAGIVTLEDIIESLVGEIQDEFETPIKDVQKQKERIKTLWLIQKKKKRRKSKP